VTIGFVDCNRGGLRIQPNDDANALAQCLTVNRERLLDLFDRT